MDQIDWNYGRQPKKRVEFYEIVKEKNATKKLALIKYLHRYVYVYVCNESDYLEWQAAIVHIFDKICATEMMKVEKG